MLEEIERIKDWLPGWDSSMREDPDPFCLLKAECGQVITIGKEIFGLGALPEINSGTGGNIAIRNPYSRFAGFVVTAKGSHKGRLTEGDLTLAELAHWDERIFYGARRTGSKKQLSSDSLLSAKAFIANPEVSVWIHFHKPVLTKYEIALSYPSTTDADWAKLTRLVGAGVTVINMVDHDFAKGAPNGKADSAIVLGKDPRETLSLAIQLIKQSSEAGG